MFNAKTSQMLSDPGDSSFSALAARPVRGLLDLGAYEKLWLEKGATFPRIADRFREHPQALPSDFVPPGEAQAAAEDVLARFEAVGLESFGVRVNGTGDYPPRLRDAVHPVELLYYRGNWDLASSPRSIAVVGTREISDAGRARTRRLVRLLVENDFTVVSGLARGVDTVAHTTAMDGGGADNRRDRHPYPRVLPARES